MIQRALCLSLSLVLLGCASSGSGMPPQEHGSHAGAGAEGHAEHRSAGAQMVSVFAGGSGEVGDGDGFTFGLDYEYRLGPRWGIGGFAEGVAGLDRSFSAGFQAAWHAFSEVILVAGPGLERRGEEWGPILRVGALYEFSVGEGWLLSPSVFYDFTEEEDLLIYGLSLGYAW